MNLFLELLLLFMDNFARELVFFEPKKHAKVDGFFFKPEIYFLFMNFCELTFEAEELLLLLGFQVFLRMKIFLLMFFLKLNFLIYFLCY